MQKGVVPHWQEEDDDNIFVILEMFVITEMTEIYNSC